MFLIACDSCGTMVSNEHQDPSLPDPLERWWSLDQGQLSSEGPCGMGLLKPLDLNIDIEQILDGDQDDVLDRMAALEAEAAEAEFEPERARHFCTIVCLANWVTMRAEVQS